ncbi:GntR family transcriptional regulator [Streptomyces sp. NPDC002187]|uniref:GntR family transcriptional regulator n=1 Tax=Streptomyces sp. NPDC002187 TaxID=3364637 RepID=UPI0036D0FE5B
MARELTEAIKDGTLLPGEEVPTIGDIAQAHGVSVGTAHRAFAQLKQAGLIKVPRPAGRRTQQPREEAGVSSWDGRRWHSYRLGT